MDYSFNIIVEDAQNTAPVWDSPLANQNCDIDVENGANFSENLDGAYSDADVSEGFNEDFTLSLSNLPAIGCIYIEDSNLVCDCNDNVFAETYTTTVKV